MPPDSTDSKSNHSLLCCLYFAFLPGNLAVLLSKLSAGSAGPGLGEQAGRFLPLSGFGTKWWGVLGAVWAGGKARPGAAVAPTQGLCIWVPSAVRPTPSASVQFLLRSHFIGAFFPDWSLACAGHSLWWDLTSTPSLPSPAAALRHRLWPLWATLFRPEQLWSLGGICGQVGSPGSVLLPGQAVCSSGTSALGSALYRGWLHLGLWARGCVPRLASMCHLPLLLQPLPEAGGSQPDWSVE